MSDPHRCEPGREEAIAPQTPISCIDAATGVVVIRGFRLEDVAPYVTFEDMVFLLWHDVLPDAQALHRFGDELAARRALEPHTLDLLKDAAARGADPIDALRLACATLSGGAAGDPAAGGETSPAREEAVRQVAAMPVIAAAYDRLSRGLEPIGPRPDLPHAANFLYMLHGREAPSAFARALDVYWNTISEDAFTTSVLAARAMASTGSDVVWAIAEAVGALDGPSLGGAPGGVLDLLGEIGSAERAEPVLRAKLARGEQLAGFGRRISRAKDPRASVLSATVEHLLERAGRRELSALARSVEESALRLLHERRPGRVFQTDVGYYTAVLLHGLGVPAPLFTPILAAGRVAGWTAHCLEQVASSTSSRRGRDEREPEPAASETPPM